MKSTNAFLFGIPQLLSVKVCGGFHPRTISRSSCKHENVWC